MAAVTFIVETQLRAINDLSKGLRQASDSTRSMGRDMERMGGNFAKMFAFRELGRVGEGFYKFSRGIIKSAADQQTALVGLRNVANFTTEEMKKQDKIVGAMAAKHAMSFATATKVQSIVAGQAVRLGNRGLAFDEGFTEKLAKFTDVMGQTRIPMATEQAAGLGIEVAEMFGARSAEVFGKELDTFYKLQKTSTKSATDFKGQLKFGAALSQSLGVSPEEFMAVVASMQSAGLSTGGRGIRGVMANMLSGKHAGPLTTGVKAEAFAGGHLSLVHLMEAWAKQRAKMGETKFASSAAEQFGKEGVSVVMQLSRPQNVESIKAFLSHFNEMSTLEQDQVAITKTLNFQSQVFDTNLKMLSASIGEGAISFETFSKASLADATFHLAEFTKNLPSGAKTAIGGAVFGAGLIGKSMDVASESAMALAALKVIAPGAAAIITPIVLATLGISAAGLAGLVAGAGIAKALPKGALSAIGNVATLGLVHGDARDRLTPMARAELDAADGGFGSTTAAQDKHAMLINIYGGVHGEGDPVIEKLVAGIERAQANNRGNLQGGRQSKHTMSKHTGHN